MKGPVSGVCVQGMWRQTRQTLALRVLLPQKGDGQPSGNHTVDLEFPTVPRAIGTDGREAVLLGPGGQGRA